MRPIGSYGDCARALCEAAMQPGPVRELAARAGVGYDTAKYTASRLEAAGRLIAIDSARPRTLIASEALATTAKAADSFAPLAGAVRSFWERE